MDVTDEIIEQIALAVVESLNLTSGETVYIRGGVHTHELIESIALHVYTIGGIPQFSSVSDSYLKRLYTEVLVQDLERPPRHYVSLIENTDAYVLIDYPKDPVLPSQVDGERIAAYRKACVSINELVYHPEKGKKWCYVAWPTLEAARHYNIEFGRLQEMIIGGILAPRKEVQRRCHRMAQFLSGGVLVHVTDDHGTDFTVNIRGRRIHIEDGFVSQYDLDTQDRGNNLPCGEVCVAPRESEGEGVLYSPLVADSMSNVLLKDVVLRFREGKLMLEQCRAAENCSAMIESFRHHMEIDRHRYGEVRTLNIAELGIGLNPNITEYLGYILTDEKIEGTAHLAFGMSDALGGTSRSSLHWDFVTSREVTVEVIGEDGSSHVAMKKGKLL